MGFTVATITNSCKYSEVGPGIRTVRSLPNLPAMVTVPGLPRWATDDGSASPNQRAAVRLDQANRVPDSRPGRLHRRAPAPQSESGWPVPRSRLFRPTTVLHRLLGVLAPWGASLTTAPAVAQTVRQRARKLGLGPHNRSGSRGRSGGLAPRRARDRADLSQHQPSRLRTPPFHIPAVQPLKVVEGLHRHRLRTGLSMSNNCALETLGWPVTGNSRATSEWTDRVMLAGQSARRWQARGSDRSFELPASSSGRRESPTPRPSMSMYP